VLAKRPRSKTPRPSRRGAARTLLMKALETAIRHPEKTVTVAGLCRVAGVSRNSLYRYHAPILKALRDHQRNCPGFAHAKARNSVVKRRAENIGLRADIGKLAALVDHYYAAYRESASLLERRDRELAELRANLQQKLALLPLKDLRDRKT
jgi:hypothetical protein